jgi:hypothetical protein
VQEIRFDDERPKEKSQDELDREDARYDLEMLAGEHRAEVEQLYDMLKIIRLPDEGHGRPAVALMNLGYKRQGNLLHDLGVRVHPELAKLKWIPSPGITPGHDQDVGKWLERNADGTWPDDDPIANLDPAKDITVQQQSGGRWLAFHKASGRHVDDCKSKAEAMATMIAELIKAQDEVATDGDA